MPTSSTEPRRHAAASAGPHRSAPGERRRRKPGGPRREAQAPGGALASDAGLTLLELLVVVGVMMLVALALPSLGGGGGPAHERAARAVAATLAEARAEAVRTARPVAVAFDPKARTFGLGAPDEALPEGVAIALDTAAEAALDADRPAILFLADGSSTGGRVLLESGDRASALTVRWLTGAIERAETEVAR